VRRFTITPERLAGGRVVFDRGESHHLSRVLRLRSGDTVLAADGAGREYTVRLETVGAEATGTVLGLARREAESPVQITLVQSIPKGDKMEAIVRASTELGVASIVPVVTARTVVRLEPGRWRDRARRWQRVAAEAAKQCGRAVVPTVETPRPLAEVMERDQRADLQLCLWEGATAAASRSAAPTSGSAVAASLPTTLPRGASSIRLLVGPEGGLSQAEVESVRAHGWTIVGAGPRILRTETAGPAIIAVLQARFGDLAVVG
jgi:16S rRNA (uracil1498-N3)-methyltransferase